MNIEKIQKFIKSEEGQKTIIVPFVFSSFMCLIETFTPKSHQEMFTLIHIYDIIHTGVLCIYSSILPTMFTELWYKNNEGTISSILYAFKFGLGIFICGITLATRNLYLNIFTLIYGIFLCFSSIKFLYKRKELYDKEN